jgi:hypothetical protein
MANEHYDGITGWTIEGVDRRSHTHIDFMLVGRDKAREEARRWRRRGFVSVRIRKLLANLTVFEPRKRPRK